MPSFTMRLHELVDSGEPIGLDFYPIYDEAYRVPLNTKIINHFYWYEIGYETAPMFAFAMGRRMSEVMPYYNKLYESELLAIDPLTTQSVSEIIHSVGSGESTSNQAANSSGESSSSGSSRSVASETPQTRLAGDADYASSMQDNTQQSSSTNSSDSSANVAENSKTTGDTNRTVKGFNGSQSDLLQAYRNTFLNIDMMVIGELNELFMQLYDTNDTFTGIGAHYPYNYFGLGYTGLGY